MHNVVWGYAEILPLFVISLYRSLCDFSNCWLFEFQYVIYAVEELKCIVFISTRRGIVYSRASRSVVSQILFFFCLFKDFFSILVNFVLLRFDW